MDPYLILAFYKFINIPNPQEVVLEQKQFLRNKDAACRIYISEQGINGQFSAIEKVANDYMEWMEEQELFQGIQFKIHRYHENVFPRQTVKYRKQLVANDQPVNISKTGIHLTPEKWDEKLEDGQEKVILDIRNDYEWKVGRFKHAECPPCQTFRDFNEYAENLEKKQDKKTPVMMYCTGGIRCEIYSSILAEKGFENVYQLDGGIINYGLKQGQSHWLGKLFVFDDRLTVPIAEKETPEIISYCHYCNTPNDSYYNCANMDCNELFLCCPECLEKCRGCCQESCRNAPRVRPYHHQNPHKPFRKWYHYFEDEKKPL